jgi:PAS domain S-box-containing protein
MMPEQFFDRQLMNAAFDCIVVIDRYGNIIDWNDSSVEAFGLSREAAIGTAFFDLTVPEDLLSNFLVELPSISRTSEKMFFTLKRGSGETFPVELSAVARGSGDDAVIIIFAKDLSEQKSIEEKVRQREEWLGAIFNNAPIEIVLKETDGRIFAISKNVADQLGLETSDFIGKTTANFLPKGISDIYMLADQRVVETGEAQQEEVLEEVEGNIRYSLSLKFPLRDSDGTITGICSMTNDITHLKQAESRLNNVKKMEAIGQLTGGVAHDFNNLLAVIMGCAEFLELEPGHDDEMVQAILHATRRGAALTHRLLAYARQQPLAPKSIDLAALAVGMKALLRRTLGETIYIEDRMASDLWAANADPGQVEDALLNLAINARDAMPRGGTLTIACANEVLDEMYVRNDPEASPGEYVVLSVNDNGEGMDDDVKARAIEPFFTTKDVGEGSGLGLSMVFGFAKQSGGHVNIESEQGRGTTVKVYLPRAESLEHKSSRQGLVHIPKGAGETILLIEDDPIVRKLTAQTLAGLGYKLLESRDAAVARTILNEGLHFDLVLSDVVLPGGTSGPEFAKEILVQRPDAHIIFMSGYPPESAVQTGFIESGSVLLSKPLRRETLADALHAALNSRR